MATLTVGAGMQYATIAAAVASAKSGDTVQIKAGTYVNDFPGAVKDLTIQGVGGIAKLVATVPPPNRKAWFVTSGNVTFANLDISGVRVADLNGAAFRYQGGSLTVLNSYIHNNQEGLLTGVNDPAGKIVIKNSEFAYNGSNGYAHNIYVGDVGTTVVDGSYIHDVLGHGSEFRSRGPQTTITNSRIVDQGHAGNYSIDLPAGGKVLISNTIIEKAAGATNPILVHFAPDGAVAWNAGSSLTITGSTLINNNGSKSWGVMVDPRATATLTNNVSYGLDPSRFVLGTANAINATIAAVRPAISSSAPWAASGSAVDAETGSGTTNPATPGQGGTTTPTTPDPVGGNPTPTPTPPEPNAGTVTLTKSAQAVTGGSTLLTVNDLAGNNTIAGGSGGLVLTAGNYDRISTAAGAKNTITAGIGSVVNSHGEDTIKIGAHSSVTASGAFTIEGAGGTNSYELNGTGSLASNGRDYVLVGQGADVGVTSSGAPVTIISKGGQVSFGGAGGSEVAVEGGVSTIVGGSGLVQVVTAANDANKVTLGDGMARVSSLGQDTIFAGEGSATVNLGAGTAGASIQGGTGSLTLMGNNAAFSFVGGAGNAVITEGSGANTIRFGAGAATVSSGSGGSVYEFVAGSNGNDLIANFNPALDRLSFSGFNGGAIAHQSVAGGSTVLALTDGTQVVFRGVALGSLNGGAAGA